MIFTKPDGRRFRLAVQQKHIHFANCHAAVKLHMCMPENPPNLSRGLTSRILIYMATGRASSLRRTVSKHFKRNNVFKPPRWGETGSAEENLTFAVSAEKGPGASKNA